MPQHHRIQKDLWWSFTGFWWKVTLYPLAREEGHPSNWHKHLRPTVDPSTFRAETGVPSERSSSWLLHLLSQVVPRLNWPWVWPGIGNLVGWYSAPCHRQCASSEWDYFWIRCLSAVCVDRESHIATSTPIRSAVGAASSLLRLDLLWRHTGLKHHACRACDAADVSVCGKQPQHDWHAGGVFEQLC